MKTLTVLIGNSDNKLTQEEWSRFIRHVDDLARVVCLEMHFKGGSAYDSKFQNAAWVFEIADFCYEDFRLDLLDVRDEFSQSSICVIEGLVVFL